MADSTPQSSSLPPEDGGKRFVRFQFPRGMTAEEMMAEIYRVHHEAQAEKQRRDAGEQRPEVGESG